MRRYYENDATVYCKASDGNENDEALCIDFSNDDSYSSADAENVTKIEAVAVAD